MTGWIILFCILAIIFFILFMPAVIDFRYEENKIGIKISYCGFVIFDTSKKRKEKTPEEIEMDKAKAALKRKKKEAKKAAKEAKKGKNVKTDTKEKRSVRDMLELAVSFITPVKKGMRKLFKGIRITKFYLDIKVGSFDAYECAIAYGKICTIVSNAFAFFQSFFAIKADHISIQPRFSTEKTVYTARFRAKISPVAVLAAGFSLLWTYLLEILHKSRQQTSDEIKDEKTNTPKGENKKEEFINADSK